MLCVLERAYITARRRRFAAALGVLLLAAGLAGAARADQARDDELKARKMFGAGNFKGALDIYTDLFARNPHPTYMRNIGRCYQNLGEPERAITAFREYLRTAKDLTPAAREEVEGFIKEMEDLQRSRAPAPPPPAAAVPPAAPAPKLEAPPPPATTSASASVEGPLTLRSAPPAEGSGSIFGRWWFWTAAAVVVAGVVTGIVLASSSSGTPTKQSDLGPMRAQF
jgi:tetratricopeptide (TPR) repeat protein